MPETETQKAKKPPLPPFPSDTVLDALNSAVAGVKESDFDDLVTKTSTDLGGFLTALIPPPPRPIPEDKCDSPDPGIAPFCATEKLDLAKSLNTYDVANMAAASTLKSALGNWDLAQRQYEFSVTNAEVALRAAVKAAADSYQQKNNTESHSRSLFLYFTMQEAVAAALQEFEASMATAGSTLAGEAGTLLAAYVVSNVALAAAQTARQATDATVEATFWQSYEQSRIAA